MAHFAELDENNIVLRVIRVDDEHEADGEVPKSDVRRQEVPVAGIRFHLS